MNLLFSWLTGSLAPTMKLNCIDGAGIIILTIFSLQSKDYAGGCFG
jgi:hypothetical protein